MQVLQVPVRTMRIHPSSHRSGPSILVLFQLLQILKLGISTQLECYALDVREWCSLWGHSS